MMPENIVMHIAKLSLAANVIPLLDRKLPAADQIYTMLHEAIITCRIPPTSAISENKICGMFGVSRSPVRTAITRLGEDGLVDIFPQRGTYVAPIKLKHVRESQFARKALEIALIKEAARLWTKTNTLEAEINLNEQRQHAAAELAWEFYLDNERFHHIIARAAGLEGVWKMVQNVKVIWDRIGHLANRVGGHRAEIISEHEAILAALGRNETRAAVAAMNAHLNSVEHAIARLRPLHNDYFVEE
jgi:GntR family transcriptional regulator, rspAB operon transcriptional repressor